MTQVSALVQAARRDGTGAGVELPTPPAVTPFFAREDVRFIGVLIQFGLLVLVIRRFDFERGLFGDVAVLAWAGFLVHHWLPARWRLPFFAVLSAVSIPLALGLRMGAFVICVGLGILALCHCRLRFWVRVGLLLVLGVVLLLLRGSALGPPIVILAGMFMFRLIPYLHDLKHQAAPFSFSRAMAYFFMLPNACFPLFPVVDYKTFCTTYYNDTPVTIYQRGLHWILRGLFHLLLYRAIYQFLEIDPHDPKQLIDLGSVAQFMVTTYLLYLRISGQFHLIVGMLHLFGFNLPETHHLYLLSSSFTDFWRRINIYWKDFLLKVFFYPAYFRLKKFGPIPALALATVFSFFVTWVLHDYQTFWLRGTLQIRWQDAFFWWTLAALVLVNALWEVKRGRARALHHARRTLGSELGHAFRTIGTFLTICTLWTIWSCQSVEELGLLGKAARNATAANVLVILAVLIGLGIAAVLFGRSSAERTEVSRGSKLTASRLTFWRSAGLVTAGACAFLAASVLPTLHAVQDTAAGEVMASLRQDRLNELEMDAMTRGYYEDLDVSRQDLSLRLATQPAPWWPATKLHRSSGDFMLYEVIPDVSVPANGLVVSFNKRGMRGPAYDDVKAPGVFRIAILGASTEAGRGVGDDGTFGRRLEERLNREDTNEQIRKFEVWNFSVEGYGAPQKFLALERRALAFDPDLVLYITYRRESERTADTMARVLSTGYEIPAELRECLTGIYAKADIPRGTDLAPAMRRLKPYMPELLAEVFQQFAAQCRKHHLGAAFVYRPEVRDFVRLHSAGRSEVLELAANTGLPVLDLSQSYAGVADKDSLMVRPETKYALSSLKREGTDDHPNAQGHQRLADELYRLLHEPENRDLLTPRNSNQPR
jgi:hypothetical protein